MIENLVFFCVTDALGGRSNELRRMVESVVKFSELNPHLSVRIMLLVQRGSERYEDFTSFNILSVTVIDHLLSASAARNVLIDQARQNHLFNDKSLFFFPDDDCWYPYNTLEGIVNVFTQDSCVDFWFCRYAAAPQPYKKLENLASVAEVTRRTSCNTIVVRGRILEDDLTFDERLGIGRGVIYVGGEDTSFALQSFGRARKSLFLNQACIGHRDPDVTYVSRYYGGGLFAIASNSSIPGVKFELLRKIFVGIYFVIISRISLICFLKATRVALVTASRA